MSGGAGSSGLNNPRSAPKDAHVMIALLREMGISDYEPRVLDHMLDFTYKYVTNVLEEARAYSSHSKKRNIDIDDVRLAIQLLSEKSFTNPPARDSLLEIARAKNSHPLPMIKSTTGARLPPDRYTLTSTNYRCKTKPKPPPQKIIQTGGQQNMEKSLRRLVSTEQEEQKKRI
ncbi:transcription initiation factor TFIID subunit 9B [Galendromus occidentalis]|uniref:Transcription initiation factor TFIID subunit 9B n=1 Tax=Galendromus occidentalis TaxID=34638 RepID=A0AAJ6VZC6_9ACAR|nr:transcription initiation factor TFIID subunit 9B [Galendromus occidentalis]